MNFVKRYVRSFPKCIEVALDAFDSVSHEIISLDPKSKEVLNIEIVKFLYFTFEMSNNVEGSLPRDQTAQPQTQSQESSSKTFQRIQLSQPTQNHSLSLEFYGFNALVFWSNLLDVTLMVEKFKDQPQNINDIDIFILVCLVISFIAQFTYVWIRSCRLRKVVPTTQETLCTRFLSQGNAFLTIVIIFIHMVIKHFTQRF